MYTVIKSFCFTLKVKGTGNSKKGHENLNGQVTDFAGSMWISSFLQLIMSNWSLHLRTTEKKYKLPD